MKVEAAEQEDGWIWKHRKEVLPIAALVLVGSALLGYFHFVWGTTAIVIGLIDLVPVWALVHLGFRYNHKGHPFR